uniref:non-specific serine/threonine protein kinase n=1 Tax=Arcella intermedia TaxID=1963864 RepID=A0A6B2L0H2_9EUKA
MGESAVRRKPGAGQKSQSPLLSDDEDTVAGKRSPLSFSSKKLLPPSPSSSSSDSAPKRKEEKKPKKASSSSDSSGDDSASGSSPAHPKRATKKSSSSTSESIEPKEKKRVNHKKPKTDARKRENEEVPLATNMAFNTIEEVQLINESLNKKRLKDFEKIKLLGRGSVGQVFLVRLKGTDQLYAMKVLEKEEMIKKNKVKRVLTEREVLATADHPFIVTLYYSFQSKDKLIFIMQYCAGGEFYRLIQTQPHKCLTEEQVKFYASEVLLALEYLHMKGFIYRDLKPENIVVHESGHIMLTDFDLSKGVSSQPKLVNKIYSGNPAVVAEPDTITNSFVGTEEYLAPEVIKGTGHTATVDWWTFGILLYEMLYGATPFRGSSRDATFSSINKAKIQFPQHKRGGITKECKGLLKALLSRDPKKRLGSIGGAEDIKDHPFFKGVKWQLIRHTPPPIIPKLRGPLDTSYFKPLKDLSMKEVGDESEIDVDDLQEDHPFSKFQNIDKSARDESDRKNNEKKKTEKGVVDKKKEKKKYPS